MSIYVLSELLNIGKSSIYCKYKFHIFCPTALVLFLSMFDGIQMIFFITNFEKLNKMLLQNVTGSNWHVWMSLYLGSEIDRWFCCITHCKYDPTYNHGIGTEISFTWVIFFRRVNFRKLMIFHQFYKINFNSQWLRQVQRLKNI